MLNSPGQQACNVSRAISAAFLRRHHTRREQKVLNPPAHDPSTSKRPMCGQPVGFATFHENGFTCGIAISELIIVRNASCELEADACAKRGTSRSKTSNSPKTTRILKVGETEGWEHYSAYLCRALKHPPI